MCGGFEAWVLQRTACARAAQPTPGLQSLSPLSAQTALLVTAAASGNNVGMPWRAGVAAVALLLAVQQAAAAAVTSTAATLRKDTRIPLDLFV